jgi:RNA polymerase sigma-70 factor (ECF subfamily)
MRNMSSSDEFASELIALLPLMRAFARMLCHGTAQADDLVQDALVKAWAAQDSFTRGTNLKAWTFTIVRNQFYSDKRKCWRIQPIDQDVAERTVGVHINPDATLELNDLRRALTMIDNNQREALVLVGAGGLSYDEAANILGIPVGTVKSRVSRGRDALERILASGDLAEDGAAPGAAMGSILGQYAAMSGDPTGLKLAGPHPAGHPLTCLQPEAS